MVNWLRNPKYRKYRIFLIIQILFLVLTFLINFVYLNNHFFNVAREVTLSDGSFHLQETHEVLADFGHHIFPALNHFFGIPGLAVPSFYPWSSFLSLMLGHIFGLSTGTNIRIFVILSTELFFNVCFYTSKTFWHSNKKSLLFTLLASLTFGVTSFCNNNDFAEAVGNALIILGLFGWLNWLKYNHWKMLATSVTLLIYIHFVSAVILIATIILLTILLYSTITKQQIINGCKAVVVTVLLTSLIWLPIIVLQSTNRIYTPVSHFLSHSNDVLLDLIYIPLIYPLILVIIALNWQHLRSLDWALCGVSIAYILCALDIIPLHFQQYSFIPLIQFPFRLGNTAFILIVIVGTSIIYSLFSRYAFHRLWNTVLLMTLICVGCLCIMGDNYLNIKRPNVYRRSSALEYHYTSFHQRYLQHKIAFIFLRRQRMKNFKYLNNSDIYKHSFLSDDYFSVSTQHYYSKQLPFSHHMENTLGIQSYIPNVIMEVDMKANRMHVINNGIQTNYGKIHHYVRVPIITYHAQKYEFFNNQHRIKPVKYQYHEPVFKSIAHGKQKITYYAPIMWYQYLAVSITLFTLLALVIVHFC